jgi:hypothetical protein
MLSRFCVSAYVPITPAMSLFDPKRTSVFALHTKHRTKKPQAEIKREKISLSGRKERPPSCGPLSL